MGSVFIQSAVILLREGVEALLILAALAAYLIKADARARLSALYIGAFLAIVASIIGAWLFTVFNNGAHNDLIEAVVIFLAAALMLYVSGWLFVRQDPKAWQQYLREKADKAIAQQTGLAIGALAFFAVFREGAETVLFIYALAKTSGGFGIELFAGLLAACVALGCLFFAINVIAKFIPLRPLFILTSALLFVMAIKMIGDAMQELQEQQYFPYTPFDTRGGLLSKIGLNPTIEALTAQACVVVAAAATYLVARRRNRRAAD